MTSKRYTLEEVRAIFETENWKLVSTEYPGAKKRVDVICNKGHEYSISLSNFKASKRCAICSNLSMALTLDFVHEQFAKEGYELLDSSYRNAKQKLKVICPQSHNISITYTDFQGGGRCKKCRDYGAPRRLSLDYIREQFAEKGWTLLATEYKNNKEKMPFICDQGHKHSMNWNNFSNNWQCVYCSKKDPVKNRSFIEQESHRIAERLRGRFKRYLDKKNRFNESTSKYNFCVELARQVVKTLGQSKDDTYSLDHILPISWFDHTDDLEVRCCWNVLNFQWLTRSDNSRKSNRLTKEQMLALTPYQVCIANLASFRPARQEQQMKKLGLWMPRENALARLKDIKTDRMSA